MVDIVNRGLQFVTNRSGPPNGVRLGTDGGRSDTQFMNRNKVKVGGSAINGIRLGFGSWYLLGGTGEVQLTNGRTVEAGLEITTPFALTIPMTINGAKIGTISADATLVLTDPVVGLNLAADSDLWVRVNDVYPSTGSSIINNSSILNARAGEAGYLSPSGPTQTPATGALSVPGGAAGYGGPATLAILGVPVTPIPAVIGIGDSIVAGNNDTVDTTTGTYAFLQRGLENVNGHVVPWHIQAVGSHSLLKNRLDTAWRGRALWPYATHLFNNMATNDVASAIPLATIQSYLIELWTAAKATIGPYGKPLKTAQSSILTRTTSNRRLTSAPSIAAGGTGYAASATFDVTLAGGTLKAGQSATTINVTTNGSGVVTTVNGISNNGIYTTAPSTPNSPIGGAGTGLSLTCAFGGWFSAADQQSLTGFAPGGVADQLNAWLVRQAGGPLLDKFVDTRPYVQDTASGLWLTNGSNNWMTDDGVHPALAGHIAAAQAVNAWALTLTV